MNNNIKVGDRVFVKNVGVGKIIKIEASFSDTELDFLYEYAVEFDEGTLGCFYEEYLERFDEVSCEASNKSCCDIQRNVTVEEVEKLEEELRRKDSELRDLKELIIKLLFDRYGY